MLVLCFGAIGATAAYVWTGMIGTGLIAGMIFGVIPAGRVAALVDRRR